MVFVLFEFCSTLKWNSIIPKSSVALLTIAICLSISLSLARIDHTHTIVRFEWPQYIHCRAKGRVLLPFFFCDLAPKLRGGFLV